MDSFKVKQMSYVGIGGMKCYCCNDWFGKNKYKLNKLARQKIKNETRKLLLESIHDEKIFV